MDADKEDLIKIDFSKLATLTWAVDGHGDAYTTTLDSTAAQAWSSCSPSWTVTDLPITQPPSGKLSLTGDDADIEINGESVVGMLREIRDRLNILQVSEEMEAEWDELRILREQYEAKLAECRNKSQIWQALKQFG